jgi:hypothetical protein
MTPQEEQALLIEVQNIEFPSGTFLKNVVPASVILKIVALFKDQAAQIDVAARIDELSHVDPKADYLIRDMVVSVGGRLEQLHNQKKEAV